MDSTKEIIDLIERIRNKPGTELPFQDAHFEIVCSYFNGYIRGLEHASGRNVNENIRRWYEYKIRKPMNVGIETYIKYKYKRVSEKQKTLLYLNTIKEFFVQNPNWHNEDIEQFPWWTEI